uniref:Neurotransmitter-gated ion-channel transmembrane domain-containing protein n=1 Tax=Acrobeloides nanus TaxID=290746 RepID=A0A914C8M9_9BILA
AKHSTIRRSSLLRDLKRIKNIEHRLGSNRNRDLCECLVASLAHQKDICNNNIETTQLSFIEERPERPETTTGESAFLGRIVNEQLMPRMTTVKPPMMNEFEERFRRILKRIYRSLQQHEIREEILDERQRIMWQWQCLASVVDRFLLILFSIATSLTVTFFLIIPAAFRDTLGHPFFV